MPNGICGMLLVRIGLVKAGGCSAGSVEHWCEWICYQRLKKITHTTILIALAGAVGGIVAGVQRLRNLAEQGRRDESRLLVPAQGRCVLRLAE